jgi:hypothetical protein
MAKRGGHITPKQKSYLSDLIAELYEAYANLEEMEGLLPEALRKEGRFGITNCGKAEASERIDQARALLAQSKSGALQKQVRQRPASPAQIEQRTYYMAGRNEPCYDLNPLDPMAERI